MKHIVGVADMKVASGEGDVIVTHALGSCLGIAVHDPVSHVGALLHVMLPQASVNPDKARVNPYMFVDAGLPQFFRKIYDAGGVKGRLVVRVAGGANVQNREDDRFAIGKRNYIMLKKMLWQNGIMIRGEDVGGSVARTMYLDVDSGRAWLHINGEDHEL